MSEKKAKADTVVVMVVSNDGFKTLKSQSINSSEPKKKPSRLRKTASTALSRAVFG